MVKGPFTLGVIPAVYRAVLRTCPISALLFISAWHPSGIALDRFQSDIPAVFRRPAVLLTNQRFCFAVVMPQPVTALAGSDAYLGHQKQDVGEFNPSCPGPRDVVRALPQGIQERQEEAARVGHDRGMDRIWANCACDIRKYWKNRSSKLCNSRTSVWNSPRWALVCSVSCIQTRRWRLFCRLCRRLNTNKSNKRSRISRRLLYAAIIDDALRWLRQRDKAVNSFAYRSLFTASLSPDVNATAGGKISRRAIYRRNNA